MPNHGGKYLEPAGKDAPQQGKFRPEDAICWTKALTRRFYRPLHTPVKVAIGRRYKMRGKNLTQRPKNDKPVALHC